MLKTTFEYFEFFQYIKNFWGKENPITSISSKYSIVFWDCEKFVMKHTGALFVNFIEKYINLQLKGWENLNEMVMKNVQIF